MDDLDMKLIEILKDYKGGTISLDLTLKRLRFQIDKAAPKPNATLSNLEGRDGDSK